MKKNAKVIIASLSLLSAFAVATPSVANADSALTAPSTSSAITTETVKINITKTGTNQPSMAAGFLGDSVKVTLDGNKVTSVIFHVDGSNNPMAKGMDLSKVISSLTINGVEGKAENVVNGSTLDYVFSGDAYKEGKGVLNITLDIPGMPSPMNESADITFDKIPDNTPATTPSTGSDTTPATNPSTGSDNTTPATTPSTGSDNTPATNPSTDKDTTPVTKPSTDKDGSKETKKPSKTTKKTTKKAKTSKKAKTTKKAKTSKKTKTTKKNTKKEKATKRTLKHNAYIYGKNAKRVNKKVLKKNHKVNTYGKAIKLHGKYFYRIATNQYVKKANF